MATSTDQSIRTREALHGCCVYRHEPIIDVHARVVIWVVPNAGKVAVRCTHFVVLLIEPKLMSA